MRTPPYHINGESHHEFNQWDLPFMWKEGTCIYGSLGVHNNFPYVCTYVCITTTIYFNNQD